MPALTRRLVAASISLAVGVALVGMPQLTTAAAAADGIPTRTVVTSTNFHPYYGQSYTIRGQVQLATADEDGKVTYTPFPKQEVKLQLCTSRCFTNTPTWKHLAKTTSDDETGVFRFRRTAWRTHVYRVVFDASKYLGIIGSSAGAILIRAHRHVPVRLTQPRPGHFAMSGRAYPFYGGQRIYLMRKSCNTCAFKTVRSQVTGPKGGYRFAFGTPSKTSLYVVRARSSKGLAVSYSKIAKIIVR